MASERAESSGRSLVISPFDTTAWIAPERAKPRMRAQVTSQVIENARSSACPTA